ncbi:MAG TPA: hypothetical protein DCX54_10030 [Flavobacteriales bacterium]|nr:hypothetical protein [Flavobacteriales bacterium]
MNEIINNPIHRLFGQLKEDDMTLLYSGAFSDNVTERIIDLSGTHFEKNPELIKLHRKSGFLIAECFQNIVRHNESDIQNGFFVSRNAHGNQFIASGNVVRSNMIPDLSEKLDHLNQLSKEELKEIYLKTLSNDQISEKGGAGLGLIEMARKTGNKLDYFFEPIDTELSYFYFQLKFELPQGDDHKAGEEYNLAHSIEMRKQMLDRNLLILYKGDVSKETILPMTEMIEQSVSQLAENAIHEKKTIIVLIELLQNMSIHGMRTNGKQDGMFALGIKDGKFILSGSNFTDTEGKNKLSDYLPKLAKMNLEEINNEYRRVLKEGDPSNVKGSSLGLIEISRRCSAPLVYDFEEIETNTYLYSLRLVI